MNACLIKAQTLLMLSAWLTGVSVMAQQTPTPLAEVRSLVQAGRLPEASKEIARQLQRSDPEPGMQLLQCVVLAQQNQTDKAIACLSALVKQHPDMLEAYNNLGVLYASINQHEEAKRWFILALQRQPSLWTLHQNLQSLQADLSRKAYARALQIELPLKDAAPKLTLLAATSMINTPAPLVAKAPDAPVITKTPAVTQTPATVVAHAPAQPPASPTASFAATSTSTSPATPAVQPEPTKPGPTPYSAQARTNVSSAASAPSESDSKDTGSAKAGKASALDAATRQQLEEAVQVWAQAWSEQNMAAYFAAYTSDYTPGKWTPRSEWEAERTTRIAGRQFVRVKVSNFSFESNGTKVIVRFSQLYESDNIRSKHRKRLEFVRFEGFWKIARETVISN